MNRSVKDRIHSFIEWYHAHDTGACRDALQTADEGLRILKEQGVSLAAVQASITARDFDLHPEAWYLLLDEYVHNTFDVTVIVNNWQYDEASGSYTVPEDSQLGDDISSWVPNSVYSDEHWERALALYHTRRWLALSNKQRGFAGILQHQQLLQSLQDWLQYVRYVEIAAPPGWRSISPHSLLSAAPAAVRAWLLADVAAGLLMQDAGDDDATDRVPVNPQQRRFTLPDTPQHHAVFQLLLSKGTAHHDEYDPPYEESITRMQTQGSELLQAYEQHLTAWQDHQQCCAGILRHQVTTRQQSHGDQQQQQQQQGSPTAAEAVLAGVRSILHATAARAAGSSKIADSCQQQQQHELHNQIHLPRDMAAALKHDVLSSGSSSIGWRGLHACLSSMGVAVMLDLHSTGTRLGLRSSYLHLQQVQLQSLLIQLLTPLQRAAAAAAPQPDPGQHVQQGQQQQQQPVDTAVTQLDPVLLRKTLHRVLGFVTAVNTAKREQQQLLLPQLKQRLEALRDAVQQQQQLHPSSSSVKRPFSPQQQNMSRRSQQQYSSSRVCGEFVADLAAGSVTGQLLENLDVADFVGLGTLQLLLQLDQQQRQQQHQQGSANTDLILKKLERVPVGKALRDYDQTEGLVNVTDPDALLLYWRARAAAEQLFDKSHWQQQQKREDTSDSDDDDFYQHTTAAAAGGQYEAWHVRHVEHLLVVHGGLRHDQAREFTEICEQLCDVLLFCDLTSCVSAHKIPVVQLPVLVRSQHGSSSSSADSSSKVLPGFRSECVSFPLGEPEISPSRVQQLGLLGSYRSCDLLIRSVLSQLPGQQQQQETHADHVGGPSLPSSCSSSSPGDTIRLQRQLLERLHVLRELAEVLRPVAAVCNSQGSVRDWLRLTNLTVQNIVFRLLGSAMPDCDPSSIQKCLKEGNEQSKNLVTQLIQQGVSRDALGSDKQRQQLLAAAAAALSSFMTQRLLWQCFNEPMGQAGLLELLQQHCRTWGSVPSSSGSSSSSDPVLESSGTTARSALALIQIIETVVASGLGNALAAAAALQQSANQFLAFTSDMSELYNTFGPQLARASHNDAAFAKFMLAYKEETNSYLEYDRRIRHGMMTQHTQKYSEWQEAAKQLRQLASALHGVVIELLVWADVQLDRPSQQQQMQEIHLRCMHLAAAAAIADQQRAESANESASITDMMMALIDGLQDQQNSAASPARRYVRHMQNVNKAQHTLTQGAQDHLAVSIAAADHIMAAALGLLASMGLLRLPELQDSSSTSLQGMASFPAAADFGASCSMGQSAAAAGCQGTSGRNRVQQHQQQLLLAWGRAIRADSRSNGAVAAVLEHISSSSTDTTVNLLQHPRSDAHSSGRSRRTDSPTSLQSSMHHSAWRLLCAIKPSYCRVLHLTQLPQQCKTYETFEATVLGQPLQQQQQQARPSSSSSRSCRCGKPATECHKYYVKQQQQIPGSAPVEVGRPHVVCSDPICVCEEAQWLSQQGPPPGFCDGGGLGFESLPDGMLEDLVVLPPQIRVLAGIEAGEDLLRHLASPEADQQQRQQQQYARALQVSLCKSGSAAGLVSRLLLLEAISQPGRYSLLHPGLRTAWQQQMTFELGSAAVPGSMLKQQQQQQQQSGDQLHSDQAADQAGSSISRQGSSGSWGSSDSGSSSDSIDTSDLQQLGKWHRDLWVSLLYPVCCRLHAAHHGESADGDLIDYEQYCLSASCRSALTCWVLYWHCCVEERGGDYSDVRTRAAAAMAASELVGADQLQHIRLPAWRDILPAPADGAGQAADACSSGCQHPPPIWWLNPQIIISSSSPSSSSSSSQYSNQTWCAALHQAGSPAFEQQCCDHCGATLNDGSTSSSGDQAVGGPRWWYCPCCCVAVYCSRACADKDRSQHRGHCRVLSNLAKPQGHQQSWDELTQPKQKQQMQLR